jgi:two-component system, NtrC family, response regulator AtoC
MSELRAENKALRKAIREGKPLYRFTSSAMTKVERLVDKIALTDSTVLVTGESGTGKSVTARAIHERSERRDGPFVSVNCAAIPEQLLESEFFGHTKGAFTSADRARKGMFLEADKGTLFLDEISELPLHMQTKLLHVIEDKQVRPVGSEQMRRVDVRIVVATNSDLTQLVSQGRFREDLYFRLSMFEIAIPPLRERPEDVRGLIQFILSANQRMNGASKAVVLDPEAEDIVLRHAWPGNVREVENVINRACILVEGDIISVDELPAGIIKAVSAQSLAAKSVADNESLHDQRRMFEAEIIRRAIYEAGGDRKLAARRLNISVSSLYSKLESRD